MPFGLVGGMGMKRALLLGVKNITTYIDDMRIVGIKTTQDDSVDDKERPRVLRKRGR